MVPPRTISTVYAHATPASSVCAFTRIGNLYTCIAPSNKLIGHKRLEAFGRIPGVVPLELAQQAGNPHRKLGAHCHRHMRRGGLDVCAAAQHVDVACDNTFRLPQMQLTRSSPGRRPERCRTPTASTDPSGPDGG